MSKITLAPNASGTGTLTVAAPNTNTDYTLTLPTATGTINTSGLANEVPAGSASAPSIYPTGDTDTGLYFPAANQVAVALGGVQKAIINPDETTFKTRFVVDTASNQLTLVGSNYALGGAILSMTYDGVFDITPLNSSFGYGSIDLRGGLQLSGSSGTSGQVLTSGGSGTAPSWAAASSTTLLGTLTTTSGASQVLSGLDLTTYKFLQIVFSTVSGSTAGTSLRLNGIAISPALTAITGYMDGIVTIAVGDGTYSQAAGLVAYNGGTPGAYTGGAGSGYAIHTSTTSMTFSWSAGNFDLGSIKVYGVR